MDLPCTNPRECVKTNRAGRDGDSPLLFITTSLVALLAIVLASQQSYRYSVVPLPNSAVVISGASTGLGRDLALTLCSKSAGAVFAGVRTADAGADLVQAARSRGCAEGSLRPLRLDVTRDDSVAEAAATVRAALAETGLKLAGIVNNAGISYRESARGLDVSEAMYVYNVNVFGVLRLTTAFLPLLERNGGRIVNTGSVAGLVGLPRWVPYSDTKHALESISDSWRRELQGEGISVSVLEPGFVRSELCTRPVCKGDRGDHDARLPPRANGGAAAKTGLMPAWFVAWLLRALPDRIPTVLTQIRLFFFGSALEFKGGPGNLSLGGMSVTRGKDPKSDPTRAILTRIPPQTEPNQAMPYKDSTPPLIRRPYVLDF